MVDVTTVIIIDRSIEEVFTFASNPDNATKWYSNIKSVDWKTPKPLQAGSQVTFEAHFLGKQLIYTYEITSLKTNEKLIMKTAEGPFPMRTTYSWKSLGADQCQMTLRNDGRPTGFSKLMAPFMEVMMRRANRKDLHQLKRLLESRG